MAAEVPKLQIVQESDGPANARLSCRRPNVRRRSDDWLEYRASDGDDAQWRPLCSPLTVVAVTRDTDGRNWGRLLEVQDADGRVHRWAMPAALLASSRGDAFRETLYCLGCSIEPGPQAAQALRRYLGSRVDLQGKELPRAFAASRIGWHGTEFVLPDRALGGARIVFQSTSEVRSAIRYSGTLESWREHVAKPACGNTRLVLAISAAFAAPLLGPLHREGAVIHLRGASSEGKTTALVTAGSVWGGGGLNGYGQSWQATANGIEAMAEAHCDVLLCLDELSLVAPEAAARMAYQLASGTGRQRAHKDGMGAARLEWRVLVLSTGEIALSDKLREARAPQRLMAGQTVRMVDMPADAGKGFGIFDHAPALSTKPNGGTAKDRGAALANLLGDAARAHYGTAGPAFVEAFIATRDASIARAHEIIVAFSESVASGADGQVQRVAQRFGLLAAAGELAVEFGVLPWPAGEPTTAARICFEAWLAARGGDGPAEIDDAIELLRATIERDTSRFQDIRCKRAVTQRLGFIRSGDDETEYLIQRESWRALMAGRDASRLARELADRGILKRDGEGRANRHERLPGQKKPERVYVVLHSALFADGDTPMEALDG